VAKKRGNPNWGKPEWNTVPYTGSHLVRKGRQATVPAPQQYGNSVQLRDWVQKNKEAKYVPSNLFELWGFEVKGES